MAITRLYCYHKWFLTIIWPHNPSPYLKFGQNVRSNDRSLRTFASLTPKNGGSFMRGFTVVLELIPQSYSRIWSDLRCRNCSQEMRVDFALHKLGQEFNWVVASTAHIPESASFRIRSDRISWLSRVKLRERRSHRSGKSAFSTPKE